MMDRKTLDGLLAVVLAAVLLLRNASLIILVVPPVLLYFLAKLYVRQVTKQVKAFVNFPDKNFFSGDIFDLELVLENRGWLPLNDIKVYFQLPRQLEVVEPREILNDLRNGVRLSLRMRGYERVRTVISCRAKERGWLEINRVGIRLTDVFGWHEGSTDILQNKGSSVVYPDVTQLHKWPVKNMSPFGSYTSHSWIYKDPFNIVGLREYDNDSVSDVDWKSTARLGTLVVRQVQASFKPQAAVFFDVITAEYFWGIRRDLFEAGIRTAASILYYLERQGSPFSFYTNGVIKGRHRDVVRVLPQGEGLEHLAQALTILAGIAPITTAGLKQPLFNLSTLGMVQSVIYIAAWLGERTREGLTELAALGYAVTLIWIGDPGDTPELAGIPCVLLEEVLGRHAKQSACGS